ncbi:hypothetical protein QL285_020110 [Trifolium repens]|nr:hypothetical protein QL285_020110 [Trifolium repens]
MDRARNEEAHRVFVLALFIATISIGLRCTPPGGVRDVSSDPAPTPTNMYKLLPCAGNGIYRDLCPGEAVAGFFSEVIYQDFELYNTISLMISVFVITVIVGGVSFNRWGLGFLRFLVVLSILALISSIMLVKEIQRPKQLKRRYGLLNEKLCSSIIVLVMGIGIYHFIKFIIFVYKKITRKETRDENQPLEPRRLMSFLKLPQD